MLELTLSLLPAPSTVRALSAERGSVIPTTVLAVSQLQPREEQRSELIALLRELAVSIHAEAGGIHYSVSQPIEDRDGPLTIIQACSSIEAFRDHSAWVRPQVPRLAALLAQPPRPPVLLEPVELSGDPKESLGS
jgi:quinol monooxygenase YgiN